MTETDDEGLVVDTMMDHNMVSHNAGLVSLLQIPNAGGKNLNVQFKFCVGEKIGFKLKTSFMENQ